MEGVNPREASLDDLFALNELGVAVLNNVEGGPPNLHDSIREELVLVRVEILRRCVPLLDTFSGDLWDQLSSELREAASERLATIYYTLRDGHLAWGATGETLALERAHLLAQMHEA